MAAAASEKIVQEDKFISFWAQAYQLYEDHRKEFTIGLAAIIVVGAAIWGWLAYQGSVERAAWTAYEEIFLSIPQDDPDKARTQSIEGLTKLLAERSGTKAADQARLNLAAISAEKGEYEPAVEGYLAYLDTLDRDDPLRPAVADALGHCFEALKKYDEAAQWYAEVAANEKLAPLGLWNLGRIKELAGEKAEAIGNYRKLTADHPQSIYASPAHDRLADLEG